MVADVKSNKRENIFPFIFLLQRHVDQTMPLLRVFCASEFVTINPGDVDI